MAAFFSKLQSNLHLNSRNQQRFRVKEGNCPFASLYSYLKEGGHVHKLNSPLSWLKQLDNIKAHIPFLSFITFQLDAAVSVSVIDLIFVFVCHSNAKISEHSDK